MAKNTKTIAEAVAESQASSAANEGNAAQAAPASPEEPKVGKVEARLAAVEAYIERNHKLLGWPEF